MKSEELRIGNLVLDTKLNKVVKVAAAAKSVISCSVLDDDLKRKEFIYSSGIESIPLSEEWVLKFGFEKKVKEDNDSNLITTYHLETPNAYFVFEDDWSLAIADSVDSYEYGWNYLAFDEELTDKVHLLQNIFYFIVGQELSYEL